MLDWTDIFYDHYNNSKNFKLNGLNRKFFQSKSITRYKLDNYFLYQNDNIISTDQAGNINIYSLSDKKLLHLIFIKKDIKKTLKNLIYMSKIILSMYLII